MPLWVHEVPGQRGIQPARTYAGCRVLLAAVAARAAVLNRVMLARRLHEEAATARGCAVDWSGAAGMELMLACDRASDRRLLGCFMFRYVKQRPTALRLERALGDDRGYSTIKTAEMTSRSFLRWQPIPGRSP